MWHSEIKLPPKCTCFYIQWNEALGVSGREWKFFPFGMKRRAGMALINSFVVVYIRFVSCNVCISDLKFLILFLTMPSESEVNLAKSLTAINAELGVGFSTLKRELTKERNAASRNWRPRLHQRQNSRKRATRNSLKLTIKSLSTLRPPLHFWNLHHHKSRKPCGSLSLIR